MTGRAAGCVVRAAGDVLVATLPAARVGDGVRIRPASGTCLLGRIAAVERGRATIAPFDSLAGVAIGDRVEHAPDALAFPAGFVALGRALDPAGRALDGGTDPPMRGGQPNAAPAPAERARVEDPFWTGIRAIDGLLMLGRGARIGIFGAPGAGKTTLLETIAAGARGDAVVVALVGERGREAQAWFERIDRRTTIVCATSDRSAAERVRAADAAMTQAQALAAAGAHVVLIVDSLARYAAALREQRVAFGEPSGRGGYPAGVWAELARYLERAGNGARGSITLLATVLTDGADEREPLGEAARSLLDGHIVLSSALARAGRYPAIDVLESTSRTMDLVTGGAHAASARRIRAALALLAETKDARALGLADLDATLAAAVGAEPAIGRFLAQRDPSPPAATLAALHSVAALLEDRA